MNTIEEKFTQILKYMGIPKEQIHENASFVKDFDFEDFQFTCLAFYLGIYFKINVREKDYSELNTIGSTISFVKKKLELYN